MVCEKCWAETGGDAMAYAVLVSGSTLQIDTEHGPREVPVEIVAETPKHYRIRLLEAAVGIGANNYHRRGEVIQVRKSEVSR